MKVVRSWRSVFKGSIFVYALGVLLFALCFSAEAQQPKKVLADRFFFPMVQLKIEQSSLAAFSARAARVGIFGRSKHRDREAIREGSIPWPACASGRASKSQGRHHYHDWSGANPCR